MDVMLTYDREAMDGLGSAAVLQLIAKHIADQVPEYDKNMDYYLGEHEILNNQRPEADAPNAQPVCNHAKDISDTASGYFLGSPITYSLVGDYADDPKKQEAFDQFLDYIDYATTDDDDQENALMLSICGKTYEYIYAAEDEAWLQEKPIDPQNAFLVYDQSIEHKPLFGVYYYEKKSDLDSQEEEEEDMINFLVMTETELRYYEAPMDSEDEIAPYEVQPHNLGYIPLVEYKNNRFAIGDFAQQIGLIDAYNTMTADRINDKEQFIDAILAIYGAVLGDTEAESQEAMSDLQANKLLELPIDAKAEYLVRQLDEGGMETLRKALKEDIYTFSHVPNLTDENFVGNSSGVAMEYKLLGLEMLTKIKERWYRRGLRDRIKIFCHYLGLKGIELEPGDIEVTFSRGLPKNLLEISQIIGNLTGEVSQKTLLGLLPFVEDPDAEIEALAAEKEQSLATQQAFFGSTIEEGSENDPPETGDDVDE